MSTPSTIALRNMVLYDATSIPDALKKYEQALKELGDWKSIAHAMRLEKYREEIMNKKYLAQLRTNFNKIYDLINTDYPDVCFLIIGRLKSLISTDNKIVKLLNENRSLDLLRDTNGFRIHLFGKNSSELISKCYSIMNDIIKFFNMQGLTLCEADPVSQTECFDPSKHPSVLVPTNIEIPEEFIYGIKDYIRHPKENGYQSLHVVFRTATGECFEIQVRTLAMHIYAETGEACHQKYKTEKYKKHNDANTVSFDRNKINIPGYKLSDDGTLYDFVGLEKGLEILRRQKTFY